MTSTKGWIAVDRSIMDHWLYSGKPFCCVAAFVDLLLKANYMDKKVLHRGELVLCKRGTVNLSIKELADCWGWSRPKVRTFLDKLEADGMVALDITSRRTVITIINYDKYQAAIKTDKGADVSDICQSESTDNTADVTADVTADATADVTADATADVTADATADVNQTAQQTYTTNNYNNVNNTTRGKGNNSTHTPPSLDEVKSYCTQRKNRVDAERFYNYYSRRHWYCGNNPIDWQSKVREWETSNYNTPHKSMEQKIQEFQNYNSILREEMSHDIT